MRYATQPSSARYPQKASSTSYPVFRSTIPQWIPKQAAQSSSVWHWYKKINNGLSAYDSVFQVANLQQFSQKQESVRIHVCLGNQILIYMRWAYQQDLTSHSDEDMTTTWGWLREESQYTPQCDKGLCRLTTTMNSVQVPVNLENDPDDPLSSFSSNGTMPVI